MTLTEQITWLFLLAMPVACIAWTVAHEEVFKEPREFCINRSQDCKHLLQRKFYYVFTCEYCFSHYITILILIISGFQLLFHDWRGYSGWLFNSLDSQYLHEFVCPYQDRSKERKNHCQDRGKKGEGF